MYKKHHAMLLADHPDAKQRSKSVRNEIKRYENKIQKVRRKIKNIDQLVERKAPMSSTERSQKQRSKQTEDEKMRERERDAERKRWLRGKDKKARSQGSQVVEDCIDDDLAEVQVQAGPGDVELGQDGGLKMKRFDVLVPTMISKYCAGVTSRLQAAHHQWISLLWTRQIHTMTAAGTPLTTMRKNRRERKKMLTRRRQRQRLTLTNLTLQGAEWFQISHTIALSKYFTPAFVNMLCKQDHN